MWHPIVVGWQHGTEFDPGSLQSPAFYYTFVEKDGSGGRPDRGRPSGGGRDCAVLLLIFVLALLISLLTTG